MNEGSFARFVPQAVMDQITVRENKYGRNNVVEYSPDDLEVIHGNTVWCLLRSGVDAPENPADRFILPSLSTINTTPSYAIASVLGGDQLQSSGLGKRAGIQLTEDSGSTFYNITDQGHKPRPGITGFTVKTLDTWGMILEANINIKVWSRDDLDLMDMVYFKPGFSALFEFGHSLYFRPDGSICKTPRPIVDNELFFKGGKFSELDNLVYEARKEDCNREAVFGYITNFSWSFNHDGSFDCTLKILSKGSVLESLGAGSNADSEKADETKQKDDGWWNASDFHRLLKALNDLYESGQGSTIPRVQTPDKVSVSEYLKSLPPTRRSLSGGRSTNEPVVVSIKEALNRAVTTDSDCGINRDLWKDFQDCPAIAVPLTSAWRDTRKVKGYYITLETLCNIVNCFQQASSPQFYLETISTTRYGHSNIDCDAMVGTEPLYLPSINPLVAIKQSQVTSEIWDITKNAASFKECVANQEDGWNDSDRILNIWVNYNVFVSLIEQQIRENKDYKIEIVLREFLNEIQKAFGNVNAFDLHADSAMTGYWEIVDRSYVGVNPEDASKAVPLLNVSGLYNTVTELKINSDVSQDIVNSMCIAATAPTPGSPGSENADECLVYWGENCRSRWTPDPDITGTNDGKANSKTPEEIAKEREQEAKARFEWQKKLKKFYEKFRREHVARVKEREDETLRATDDLISKIQDASVNLQLDGERYYKNQVRSDAVNGYLFQPGIIPFKMTLTMLGISRLYIGNTFKIRNGILPKKYDNWGYIITGIEHSVRNNQWFTTLTTNYYPVFPIGSRPSRPVVYRPEGSTDTPTFNRDSQMQPTTSKDRVQVTGANSSRKHPQLGDQTETEVYTKSYSIAWMQGSEGNYQVIYRNKNSADATAAAAIAVRLAASPLVGYWQPSRSTLYEELINTYKGNVSLFLESSKPVGTDCSAFIHTCYAAANSIYKPGKDGLMRTAWMQLLISKGEWEILDFRKVRTKSELRVGDILWKPGHVELVTAV